MLVKNGQSAAKFRIGKSSTAIPLREQGSSEPEMVDIRKDEDIAYSLMRVRGNNNFVVIITS